MLVTVLRYRSITGDQVTGDEAVSARIEEATELLEGELGRPLEQAERTERMQPTRDGLLWPLATPLVAATDYTIDGHGLTGASVFGYDFIRGGTMTAIDVTYTGGWLERTANPSSAFRLPVHIERDIAFAAQALGQTPTPLAVPAGASSVSLGDASVTFKDGYHPDPADAGVSWSKETLGYRYRRVGGYPPNAWAWA